MSSYAATRCRHLKINGTQCGSPALRNKHFCFYHQQHRPQTVDCYFEGRYSTSDFILPDLEDACSIQTVIRQVVKLLLQESIERKTASLLLYALQIAASNLKRMELDKPQPEQVVVSFAMEPITKTPMAVLVESVGERSDNAQPEENSQTVADLPPGTIHACSSPVLDSLSVRRPQGEVAARRPADKTIRAHEQKKRVLSGESRVLLR